MKEKKLWFKAKRYGYGWYPVTWQGWLIISMYMFAVIKGTWNIEESGYLNNNLLTLVLRIVLPTIFLLVICFLKGEKPRWR